MLNLSPTREFGYCRFPRCEKRGTCICDDCGLAYCDAHSYDVTRVMRPGVVCEICRDRRLSLYTGVTASQFVSRATE